MTVLEQGQIQIHTENIFPIIKKAVYSGHEVFLRELVSNGVDAISKRRMASMAGDCSEGAEGRISIRIDREANTLTISDNGIGMSADEVKRYINQVAFSSAEDFLEKYKQENDAIIGHFGLGFYSSFMVAKQVELVTLSARDGSEAVRWSCDGSPNFSLEAAERSEPGTDVILHLMEEEEEYIEPARIRTLITTYCDFMPVEVELEGETVNKREAPWRKSPRDLTDNDYIELYRYLYPFQGDPLLWVHLNTDYPYNLQGILFFPKSTGRADWEKGEIKLYCNNVFVSDSIKEVVPRYLLPLRGVIDSPDIPLNVSRSALQTDRRVRSIGSFVAKKVGDRLKQLHQEDPKRYAEIWESLAPFIKIGAMEDDKFAEQVADLVLEVLELAGGGDRPGVEHRLVTRDPLADLAILERGSALDLELRGEADEVFDRADTHARADRHALVHQRRDRDGPAVADTADALVVGDADVGEEDFVKLTAARHLLDALHGHARCLHVHDEHGEALVLCLLGVRARQEDPVVGIVRA